MLTFVRYIISAGIASVVDLAVAQSLLGMDQFSQGLFFGFPILLGALAGMSVNFMLAKRYVFTSQDSDAHDRATQDQMRTFFLVSVSTMFARLMVAYVLISLFSQPLFGWINALPVDAAPARLAQIGAMGTVAIYSFFAHKYISFAGGLRHWLATHIKAH